MSGPQILIVDDCEDDVLLASAYIRRSIRGARFRRVNCAAELCAALAEQAWDLVLCDHNMPSFDSTGALALVRKASTTVPNWNRALETGLLTTTLTMNSPNEIAVISVLCRYSAPSRARIRA